MSFPKRSAEDLRDDQGGKRQKGDKDGISNSSLPPLTPTSIVLSSKQDYIVEIEGLGRLNFKDNWFRSSGGSNAVLKLNDAIFRTKVAVSDSRGTKIFYGGGGDNKLVSIRRNQEDGITTVSLVEEKNNKNIGYSGLPSASPVEAQISRNEVVNVHGIPSVIITAGDGGHVIHNGCGMVCIEGNVQSVNMHGTGNVRINGDVEEGLNLTGLGYVVVYGNVRGDIQVNGISSLTVFGKHLGNGNLSRGWMTTVRFLEEDGKGEDNGNEAPRDIVEESKTEDEEEDKTEYDDWKWEEIVSDIMSDDEEDVEDA